MGIERSYLADMLIVNGADIYKHDQVKMIRYKCAALTSAHLLDFESL